MTALLTLNTGNDGSLDYDAFLREKVAFDRAFGFEVTDDQLSPIMREGHPDFKPHQAAFSGLGSTVLEAVRQGRRGYGSELNPASVADSLVYLRQHDAAETTPTLFELLDLEGSAA